MAAKGGEYRMAKKDNNALFQNGDPDFRKLPPIETDPYERGFADCLYNEDEPLSSEEEYEDDEPYDSAPIIEDDFDPQGGGNVPPTAKKHRFLRKKKHRFLRFLGKALLVLLLLIAVTVAALHFLAVRPGNGEGHKAKSTTILLAGTDASGNQTDTLMLLNVDREANRLSLLSIPRDTKVNCTYQPKKINGAYVANGKGENGMDALMGYVADCVGFRPDGYVLIDLDVFVELVDLFGGVDFNVPQDMFYEDPSQDLYIDLQAGEQTLNGKNAMGLVRYRSGYSMADLQRVQVQRDFLMEAVRQWKSPTHLIDALRALPLLEKNTLTDLSFRELTWLAESAALCGTDGMVMQTVPYYLSDVYVCIDAGDAYLELINTYFNPYETEVGYGDLNIAY